jgi:hypothetical protein
MASSSSNHATTTESETERDEGDTPGGCCERDCDDDRGEGGGGGDGGGEGEEDFVYNHAGLADDEAVALLNKHGRNELPEKIVPGWRLFLDQFRAPMPVMIWLAIVIEAAIHNWIDAGILLAIQFTNAGISFYELDKAGNAIRALKNGLKPTATCKRNGTWAVLDATLLVPGDLVLLASGSGESSGTEGEDGYVPLPPSMPFERVKKSFFTCMYTFRRPSRL